MDANRASHGSDSTSASSPRRWATGWQLRRRRLQFGRLPLLMGIVNVTPDSFSDGGLYFSHEAAITRALDLVRQGAELVDIGGESTRPYARPVDAKEELRRVLPVVEAVCRQTAVPVSIDTYKAEVAREALAAGAEIINDVTGLEGDPEMVNVARDGQAAVCVMHMQGAPETMQDNPAYGDVVLDVYAYLERRLTALVAAGISADRVCLDPGIGFGKTHQHNLTLLANCAVFHRLGCPVLVGHSRKGFIAKVLGKEPEDRTAGTIGVALGVARQRVQILRVHEVKPVRQAMMLFDAIGGIGGVPGWEEREI